MFLGPGTNAQLHERTLSSMLVVFVVERERERVSAKAYIAGLYVCHMLLLISCILVKENPRLIRREIVFK